MVLKPFSGSMLIFVVVPERRHCKCWKCLSQDMSKYKLDVFKLYMLNI